MESPQVIRECSDENRLPGRTGAVLWFCHIQPLLRVARRLKTVFPGRLKAQLDLRQTQLTGTIILEQGRVLVVGPGLAERVAGESAIKTVHSPRFRRPTVSCLPCRHQSRRDPPAEGRNEIAIPGRILQLVQSSQFVHKWRDERRKCIFIHPSVGQPAVPDVTASLRDNRQIVLALKLSF